MLFLMMGFICLFYENKFMLISGGHISNLYVHVLHMYTAGYGSTAGGYILNKTVQKENLQRFR